MARFFATGIRRVKLTQDFEFFLPYILTYKLLSFKLLVQYVVLPLVIMQEFSSEKQA